MDDEKLEKWKLKQKIHDAIKDNRGNIEGLLEDVSELIYVDDMALTKRAEELEEENEDLKLEIEKLSEEVDDLQDERYELKSRAEDLESELATLYD